MTRSLYLAVAALLLAPASGSAGDLSVDLGYLFEPIVITAPRRKIPQARVVDPRVNALLLRLLQQHSELRPEAGSAQNTEVFSELTTLTGHMMSLRYSELGFLLTEGLAGIQDFTIQNELAKVVRTGKNPQMRAAAMVSLAYTKDARFVPLFQEALLDKNLTVRLGALESLVVCEAPNAQFSVADAAHNDASYTAKVMAAAATWEKWNPIGREMLLALAENPDWYVRADAIYNIGRLGGGPDYRKLMDILGREENPIVRAELTLALIRLQKFK